MVDNLQISALRVNTQIGVHAWEQRIKQVLLLDITLPIDIGQCNDDIHKTIDYDALCREVTAFLEQNAFALIETAAEKTVQFIQQTFDIEHVTLSVSKPHAIANAGNISIILNR
jgi:dihydroneopterin aldolase